jgi:fatty acid desaturase
MQDYATPKMSEQAGRQIWHAMLHDVTESRLMQPDLIRMLLKLVGFSFSLGLMLLISWSQVSAVVLVACYFGIALLLAQFAFVGHDAGHGAASGVTMINRVIGQFSMTCVTGLAFDEWSSRHRTHHRFCQCEASDPDMAVSLVVSLTEYSKLHKGTLGRWLTRHQSTHIWFLSLLFGHSQRLLSQLAVLARPHRYPIDALGLFLHFALWFGVPIMLLDTGLTVAMLTYLVPLTLLGPYLASIFWVNHIGMPLIADTEQFSFLERQSVTSRTITNPPSMDWIFGGLNYQIEHHLFPQVPSGNLARVQCIVRKHFDLGEISYNKTSWWGAIREIAAHLRRVGAA